MAATEICAAKIRSWRSLSTRDRKRACSRSSRRTRSSKSLVAQSGVSLLPRRKNHTVADCTLEVNPQK
jgi:hypothetical protein